MLGLNTYCQSHIVPLFLRKSITNKKVLEYTDVTANLNQVFLNFVVSVALFLEA